MQVEVLILSVRVLDSITDADSRLEAKKKQKKTKGKAKEGSVVVHAIIIVDWRRRHHLQRPFS